ncbi:MAG: hypothetical protein ACRD6N_13680 [Pyrinomonadaceae bacterium]
MNEALPELSTMCCTVEEMTRQTLTIDIGSTTHPLPRGGTDLMTLERSCRNMTHPLPRWWY